MLTLSKMINLQNKIENKKIIEEKTIEKQAYDNNQKKNKNDTDVWVEQFYYKIPNALILFLKDRAKQIYWKLQYFYQKIWNKSPWKYYMTNNLLMKIENTLDIDLRDLCEKREKTDYHTSWYYHDKKEKARKEEERKAILKKRRWRKIKMKKPWDFWIAKMECHPSYVRARDVKLNEITEEDWRRIAEREKEIIELKKEQRQYDKADLVWAWPIML